MNHDDRFFVFFGKATAMAGLVWMLLCLAALTRIIYLDYRDSESRPYATIAPDTTRRTHK